jgi:hypothetical protein
VAGTLALPVILAVRRLARTGPAGAPLGLGARVPFGPMLAVGGALYFLFLHGPVDAWFDRFLPLF